MPEKMSISVNGHSQVPPGFRFHPTEEELLYYYLKKKVSYEKIDLDVIREVDLNKLEPWDIQEKCRIGTAPQNDWYFFSHKDKKYPTGTRTNRATAAGFWKATGRDKRIYGNGRRIGMRKTLVFYKGRAPHGQKSDWIMHEYRLDDDIVETNVSNVMGDLAQEEGWVVCRIFKKRNYHKTLGSPLFLSSIDREPSSMFNSLDQIFEHMDMACKQENEAINGCSSSVHDKFMKLPALESPNSTTSQHGYTSMIDNYEAGSMSTNLVSFSSLNNWAALDRLVASQLNGQTEISRQFACFNDLNSNPIISQPQYDFQFQRHSLSSGSRRATVQECNNEIEPWSFTDESSTSTRPAVCHVSNYSV